MKSQSTFSRAVLERSIPGKTAKDTGSDDTLDPAEMYRLYDTRAEEWDREKVVLESFGWVVFLIWGVRSICQFVQWCFLARLMLYTLDGRCDWKPLSFSIALAFLLIFRNCVDGTDDHGGTRLTTRCTGWPVPEDAEEPGFEARKMSRELHLQPWSAWLYTNGRDVLLLVLLALGFFVVAPEFGQVCHKYYDVALQDTVITAVVALVAGLLQDMIFSVLFCLQNLYTKRIEPFLRARRGSRSGMSRTSIDSSRSIDEEELEGMEEAGHTKICDICEENFVNSDKVVITACNHMFHEHCLQLRVKTTSKCPTCGADLSAPKN